MLQISKLTKQFGSQQVLKGISARFPEKQTTVIVGPSGSGKTTLLRSLDLLVRPDSGELTFDDLKLDFSQPISSKQRNKLRNKTSMVFQNWNLFPNLTILQNITSAPIHVHKVAVDQAEHQAHKLLQEVGLDEYATSYPHELSGGQQQRISICRALAVQPQYVLLDEPTSALDPERENQILRMLERLSNEGNSLIMVTHNMQFAKNVADKILFLEDGELQFDGDKEAFFSAKTDRIQQFLQGVTLN
ncbi:amino acid ABC transporter ATP-binding protein [Fructilactobacillus florum]|uniref:amino acid ABC transporter ATP-binding protein n=1 Tax=Fructilactobacillus florum TaxID=640331 RepID=UPI00028CEA7F|nr:amino acid ABC transporter ATP-binding protein [Fructilactobacillus florum]EKK20250.1 Cell division transporter, ATP-binding protein FtsE [Fructilactobacillus florum 2F]